MPKGFMNPTNVPGHLNTITRKSVAYQLTHGVPVRSVAMSLVIEALSYGAWKTSCYDPTIGVYYGQKKKENKRIHSFGDYKV
jgi:hypothetical protein